ncbi:MAG TPA: type III pantothenate kinase, partial [Pyrinomonadaceae bacterium]|nr:type III pantothenate kinase [Pyrinomonadaceae bacterium]
RRDFSKEELELDRLRKTGDFFIQNLVTSVVISSVVPEVDNPLTEACQSLYKVKPRFIDETWDFGFEILYEPPSHVGSDRLVNLASALKKYGAPVIVLSFGTATTLDVINQNKQYIGGIIAAGVGTSMRALAQNASLLTELKLEPTKNLIANNTRDAVLSGIVNGHIAMVDELLARVLSEAEFDNGRVKRPTIVATGGFSTLIAPNISQIQTIDENLTIEGIAHLYKKNLQANK